MTLLEDIAFFKGGVATEIVKISHLVATLGNSDLTSLMQWPLQVIAS